jgi:S-adenosylmethionine decarboxylase
MAFNDALFQLGMDLARSSTTQTEDLVACASASSAEVRKDFFVERDGVSYAGSHLIIDVFGASRLDDQAHMERTLAACAEQAGATLLHIHTHKLPSGGVAGVAVLAESHISVHSWPERGYAAFDVFMSGGANPHAVLDELRDAFAARDVVVKEHRRGGTASVTSIKRGKRPASRAAVRPVKSRKAA